VQPVSSVLNREVFRVRFEVTITKRASYECTNGSFSLFFPCFSKLHKAYKELVSFAINRMFIPVISPNPNVVPGHQS